MAKLFSIKLSSCRLGYYLLLFTIFLYSCHSVVSSSYERETEWAQKVDNTKFANLYRIDENVYRSEQPSKDDMRAIEEIGIHSVLNLRNTSIDNDKAISTSLKLFHVPINTWRISYPDIIASLKVIRDAPKPILVHCLHGSDRTGCVVACYRIAFQHWSKEDAIKEMKDGGFGFHERTFSHIITLIKSIDTQQLIIDVNHLQ